MIPASDFQFYAKSTYFEDFISRVVDTKAGDRVALATMTFEPSEPVIARLLDTLGQAAARGVQVNLCIDAHVFLRAHSKELSQKIGPLFWNTKALQTPDSLAGIYRQKYDTLMQLQSRGVHFTVTNQPQHILSNPVGGRSHIKYSVINNRVYIGGCNMDKPQDIDIMTGWNDAKSADTLFAFSNDTIKNAGTRFMDGADRSIATSNGDTIYIDAGKKRQSIILEQAWRLIDDAKTELFMTCQYFPNSKTAQRLAAAYKRGVAVTIIYNHASQFPKPDHILQHISATTERLRVPSDLFKHQLPLSSPYIHAKVLASESSAMIGSHNYIPAGVNFGTAEIALLRHDAEFSHQIVSHMQATIQHAQAG